MRTTLEIEDDVLQAAKELAEIEGTTAGKIISKLVRRALTGPPGKTTDRFVYRNGIPQRQSRGEIITLDHVQKIMDEEGI